MDPALVLGMDPALVLGGLGFATGALSLIYAHSQARAARRQAEEASRVAVLEASMELQERYQGLRRRAWSIPSVAEELRVAAPGYAKALEDFGLERTLLMRDFMDTAQDAFFLRRRGIVTDAQWQAWTRNHIRLISATPSYRSLFETAAEAGGLHPDFIEFQRAFFEGRPAPDPLARK